ncbi:flagellar basal body P-ring formation chaperone FlgA [Legionella clemsonensis]|uniref:Flagella basal body P-ring formation protein FlgA n=1 Tax=Legionella clemsonensis TaxID=1867846 RepID=A0A222P2R4_9GAMM|nr:flagellar basal body P-ring formation chaperone FlgA [Legionella clemsonensis]ASQ46117.1 flagellar basal body P-ring biosynthesis protein FlgA [Legionella clemsonensis]
MKQVILAFFLLITHPTLQATESIQSLDLLKQKIENYVLASLATQQDSKIQVAVDQIDPRLKLKTCQENHLEVFNPYQVPAIRANTLGIKCQETNNRWTLFVPVKIIVQKLVVTAKHPLIKGTLITEDDLETQEIDISQLKQGYFNKVSDVINQICKTNIAQGGVITPHLLRAEPLVHKGERIAIQALSENFSVSMEGIALNDGADGDLIRVKNLSSKKIIEAQVSAKRQVRVSL